MAKVNGCTVGIGIQAGCGARVCDELAWFAASHAEAPVVEAYPAGLLPWTEFSMTVWPGPGTLGVLLSLCRARRFSGRWDLPWATAMIGGCMWRDCKATMLYLSARPDEVLSCCLDMTSLLAEASWPARTTPTPPAPYVLDGVLLNDEPLEGLKELTVSWRGAEGVHDPMTDDLTDLALAGPEPFEIDVGLEWRARELLEAAGLPGEEAGALSLLLRRGRAVARLTFPDCTWQGSEPPSFFVGDGSERISLIARGCVTEARGDQRQAATQA